VLATECLDRRVDTFDDLIAETAAWTGQRNSHKAHSGAIEGADASGLRQDGGPLLIAAFPPHELLAGNRPPAFGWKRLEPTSSPSPASAAHPKTQHRFLRQNVAKTADNEMLLPGSRSAPGGRSTACGIVKSRRRERKRRLSRSLSSNALLEAQSIASSPLHTAQLAHLSLGACGVAAIAAHPRRCELG
jgi:hypothetical protein